MLLVGFTFFLGHFWLNLWFVLAISFLKCNLISNYFWLTSSGGCPNLTFRRLIPQGTQNQGGQTHLAKTHVLTESSIWHCSFQTSSHLFLKKDIRSFRHYLSYDCIIAIRPPFFQFCCCCIITLHWASRMVCNSLQFILSASYHCLVHREFHSLINYLNWVFNFLKSF